MSKTITRIELYKENFKFSSGHFTIFSETERENIHGHNFTVGVGFDCEIVENGIIFDYGIVKKYIEEKCRSLNEYFLVPEKSKYLKVEHGEDYIFLHFNGEKIPFLPRDLKFLPVENITVEDMATYFLDDFVQEFVITQKHPISYVEVKVFSGPGQSGGSVWKESDNS